MIFADRQKKIWIPRMKLELIDGIPMTYVMLDALHCDVVDHPNNATGTSYSQQRMACVGVVGPGTRVEVLFCICIHIRLQESYFSLRVTFIQSYPVTPDCGKHQRVSLLAVPVKLDSKQWLSVVLPQTVDTFKRISALLGLPLALAPALSAWSIGSVCGCVWPLCVCPTLNTNSIILQMQKKKKPKTKQVTV